jgi:hypothetical protein
MATDTCLKVYKSLLNKPINAEHNLGAIIGHVISVGFSKFNSDYASGLGSEMLTEEEIRELKDAFNFSYAAVLYSRISDDLVEAVMQSNNPESNEYLTLSSSWEVGFNDYVIAKGSYNISECEIITAQREIDMLKYHLKCMGGNGTFEGKPINRLIIGEPVFLGGGLTYSPASEVKGVWCNFIKEVEAKTQKDEKTAKSKENVSQNEKTSVKENSMKLIAKWTDLQGIKQEELTEYSVANIHEIIKKEIEQAAVEAQKSLTQEKENSKNLQEGLTKANEELKSVKEQLEKVQVEQKQQKALADLSAHMELLDKEYNLNDEMRKTIMAQIQSLDEAGFNKWLEGFAILAKAQKKQQEAKASDEEKAKQEAEAKRIAEEAMKKAEAEKQTLAAGLGVQDLVSKLGEAFKLKVEERK